MQDNVFETYLAQSTEVEQDVEDIRESRNDLNNALQKLEGAVVTNEVPTITTLSDDFGSFSAKVALIGQVKAGKTALVNALLGVSDLLPSDVNPWTSVVTSVHVNCTPPNGKRAIFNFFDEQDWEDLVSSSGRIVKLAKKARLDSQLDELTEQIEALKERTEGRLGKNFKMLLGNRHAFTKYDADLIKRYVCLGEDDVNEDKEGRFADLTKSADLYLENSQFNYPVTIADTPGVNDPFLVREAATLQNLGDCDICIVVLSAHQALSSVDLGLMRVLKSLKSKRLIAFVNRIDELPDPHNQVREIRDYIAGVLKKQNLDGDIPIVFGSAAWADAAIIGNYDNLPEDSVESLAALVEARSAALKPGASDDYNIDNLVDVSGIRALRATINRKVWEEVYRPKVAADANRARRIAERSLLYLREANKGPDFEPNLAGIDKALSELKTGQKGLQKTLDDYGDSAKESVKMNMATTYMSFIKKEKIKLTTCLSKSGKVGDWAPDTEGLRTDLNAVYSEFDEETVQFFGKLNDKLLKTVSGAYNLVLGTSEGVRITPLPVRDAPLPLSLMRTMSIDLRASSSFDWLRRKLDKSVYLSQFEAIATDDMRSTIDEICAETIELHLGNVGDSMQEFLREHFVTIKSLSQQGDDALEAQLEDLRSTDIETAKRMKALRDASDVLLTLEAAFLDDEPDDVAQFGVAT